MTRFVRRHWIATGLGCLALGAGTYVSWDVISLAVADNPEVTRELPSAPALTARPGETVYRIDASRSKVTVEVGEKLAGSRTTATLTTRAIAGDLAVSADSPASGRAGDIVVDLEQLSSDNPLRDKAIRLDYLESSKYPLATLSDIRVSGLPDTVDDGKESELTLTGSLTAHDTTVPVTWTGRATRSGDTLTARVAATVSMRDFGVGPISKVGLVSTDDEVDITIDLTAVEARNFTPPAALAVATGDPTSDAQSPDFSTAIQPVLEANCASCHREGALGAPHFKLQTAGDAADLAAGIEVVTRSGYMPPWPAGDAGVALKHPRGLTSDAIEAIRAWAKAGGKLDVPRDTPITPPATPEVSIPDVDMKLTWDRPYAGDGSKVDDYRCFILDPKLTERSFLTGYVFEPQRLDVVHHALTYRIPARMQQRIKARDGADGRPGYDCFGSMSGQLIGGWVPGQRPMDFEGNVGYEFQAGDLIMVQIHYHYEGSYPTDQSVMKLEFADDPDTVQALHTSTLIGPVELPCPAGASEPLCNRDAALADAAKRFGPIGAVIPNVLHGLCGTTVESVAAKSDGTHAETTCDFKLGETGDIVDVLGHMHEMGSSYTMTLNPDSDHPTVLLDIPVWNFDWQLNYQPVKPVPVTPDDVVRITCRWDRSIQPQAPMRYIVFAEGTGDEMCFSTVTVLPKAKD